MRMTSGVLDDIELWLLQAIEPEICRFDGGILRSTSPRQPHRHVEASQHGLGVPEKQSARRGEDRGPRATRSVEELRADRALQRRYLLPQSARLHRIGILDREARDALRHLGARFWVIHRTQIRGPEHDWPDNLHGLRLVATLDAASAGPSNREYSPPPSGNRT